MARYNFKFLTELYVLEIIARGDGVAEAGAANKSLSALVRDWLEEWLDLPAPV